MKMQSSQYVECLNVIEPGAGSVENIFMEFIIYSSILTVYML